MAAREAAVRLHAKMWTRPARVTTAVAAWHQANSRPTWRSIASIFVVSAAELCPPTGSDGGCVAVSTAIMLTLAEQHVCVLLVCLCRAALAYEAGKSGFLHGLDLWLYRLPSKSSCTWLASCLGHCRDCAPMLHEIAPR